MLYYRIWFLLAFATIEIYIVTRKMRIMRFYYGTNAPLGPFELMMLALYAFFELVRLYYGFLGNMRENIASLSAFLMLCVLPHFLVLSYFSFAPMCTPITTMFSRLNLILTVAEAVLAAHTVRKLVAQKKAEFLQGAIKQIFEEDMRPNGVEDGMEGELLQPLRLGEMGQPISPINRSARGPKGARVGVGTATADSGTESSSPRRLANEGRQTRRMSSRQGSPIPSPRPGETKEAKPKGNSD